MLPAFLVICRCPSNPKGYQPGNVVELRQPFEWLGLRVDIEQGPETTRYLVNGAPLAAQTVLMHESGPWRVLLWVGETRHPDFEAAMVREGIKSA